MTKIFLVSTPDKPITRCEKKNNWQKSLNLLNVSKHRLRSHITGPKKSLVIKKLFEFELSLSLLKKHTFGVTKTRNQMMGSLFYIINVYFHGGSDNFLAIY